MSPEQLEKEYPILPSEAPRDPRDFYLNKDQAYLHLNNGKELAKGLPKIGPPNLAYPNLDVRPPNLPEAGYKKLVVPAASFVFGLMLGYILGTRK